MGRITKGKYVTITRGLAEVLTGVPPDSREELREISDMTGYSMQQLRDKIYALQDGTARIVRGDRVKNPHAKQRAQAQGKTRRDYELELIKTAFPSKRQRDQFMQNYGYKG